MRQPTIILIQRGDDILSNNMVKRIKRINERIADIARTFGTQSNIYNEYESRIVTLFPTSYHYSKKGYISLSHGKKVVGNPDTDKKLMSIEVLPTKGEIVKRSKKRLKDKGILNPKIEDVKREVERKDRVENLINDNLDLAYAIKSQEADAFIDYMRQSEKDYDEMEEKIGDFLLSYGSAQYELRNLVEELESENGYIPKRTYKK